MESTKMMLNNLASIYGITYRILLSEEKDYYKDSPSFHVLETDKEVYLLDLSNAKISKDELKNLLIYTLNITRQILNINKKSNDDCVYDILTHTYNRGYFEEKIKEQHKAVIVVGDVNNLKVMNDVFGHSAGDELLVVASNFLKKHAKENYIIARCGGDEFNIIIPNGTLKEAANYCKNIQQECQQYNGDLLLKPQIALGYSEQRGNEDISEALKRADDYMYKNKILLKEKSDVIYELEQKMYELNYADKTDIQNKLNIALSFGLYLDLSLILLSDLALAIKIEEIGMLAVPRDIKLKKEPLTDEEKQVIKKHPEVGFRLAKLDNSTLRIATTIYQTHEHYDGSGYPCGIKGRQIDYLARIIAIASAYSKVYRRFANFGEKEAMRVSAESLKDNNAFDPVLVRKFSEYIEESISIRYGG